MAVSSIANIVKATILNVTLQLELLDSESDDDDLMNIIVEKMKEDKRKARSIKKIETFVEETVPFYNPTDFKQHFRLTKECFEGLLRKISPILDTKGITDPGRRPVSPQKQLLCCLWTLPNQESFRGIGDRFNVSRRTAWNILNKVIDSLLILNENEKIIFWPLKQDAEKSMEIFYIQSCFPGIIGCIDGKHMAIKAPTEEAAAYRNKYYSVILQAVCNEKMAFLDCYVGEAGSVHDARVFRRSALHERVETGDGFFGCGHILDDSAYPLSEHLLTPYRDNGNLNSVQKLYNNKLAKCRNIIERAFAHLVGRFKRLEFLDVSNGPDCKNNYWCMHSSQYLYTNLQRNRGR
ncbi:uncharacterized protein [Centruroides vittatus]|uniref:uncharacterized protein n=1 Tax=Centruroides vittatus TaxID=120091 RepID=UPI00350FAA00